MQLRWNRAWTAPSIAGVISFGVGVGIGYFIGKRMNNEIKDLKVSVNEVENEIVQLQFRLDDRSEQTKEALQYAWRIIGKVDGDEPDAAQKVVDSVWARVNEDESRRHHPSVVGFEPESESVFPDEEIDDWDYDEELSKRTPDAPYIIHKDEYDGQERDFSQSTLTYYKGDDVLCDDHDMPIYNADKLVGKLEFGKGSKDPSIVFIRNEKLEADYEVILDHGYFQVEVLGEEIEKNFNKERSSVPKFRDMD